MPPLSVRAAGRLEKEGAWWGGGAGRKPASTPARAPLWPSQTVEPHNSSSISLPQVLKMRFPWSSTSRLARQLGRDRGSRTHLGCWSRRQGGPSRRSHGETTAVLDVQRRCRQACGHGCHPPASYMAPPSFCCAHLFFVEAVPLPSLRRRPHSAPGAAAPVSGGGHFRAAESRGAAAGRGRGHGLRIQVTCGR